MKTALFGMLLALFLGACNHDNSMFDQNGSCTCTFGDDDLGSGSCERCVHAMQEAREKAFDDEVATNFAKADNCKGQLNSAELDACGEDDYCDCLASFRKK